MSNRRRPRRILAETPGTYRPERVTGDAPGDLPASFAFTAPPAGEPGGAAGVPPVPPAPPAAPVGAAPAPVPAAGPVAAPAGPGAPAPETQASNVHVADVLAAIESLRTPGVYVRSDPSPYDPRLEASRGRSFFLDVAASERGDSEARARVAQFQGLLAAYIQGAMDTASTSDVIPPAWGGAWYVEQLEQLRPMVSSFSSVNVTDNREIPVPVFTGTTPAQIVTEHTEGDPPTEGSVDVTQISVKPKAYSGKAPFTRELLDSNPALVDRIVSEALLESYSQVTEAAMVAVIDAGATAGPAGGATAVTLEAAIRRTLAAFPSTRFRLGGRVLPSAAHYGALASANDQSGRPLMPYIGYGPTNAPGVSAEAFGSMQIVGVLTVPSWANGPTKTYLRAAENDALSFESSLLNFRFYEQEGPEKIVYAVWGYFGALVRRPVGVVAITSTATFAEGGSDAPPPAARSAAKS